MKDDTFEKRSYKGVVLDETREWTKLKHGIIKEYAQSYSTILAAQQVPRFSYIYIDAFSGAGLQYDPAAKDIVFGSPLKVLEIEPPFNEYHFIDIDRKKTEILREMAECKAKNVYVYMGDCNDVLLNKIFPSVEYKNYRRALCFIDPYGLDFDWEVIETAGKMGTIDLILNFSIMDANRNIFRSNPDKISESQKQRANRSWGNSDWREIGWDKTGDLFGKERKVNYAEIVEAFRSRLKKVAHFKCVPKPIQIRSKKRAPLYYLFFASQKQVAARIANDIFKKYREKGGRI